MLPWLPKDLHQYIHIHCVALGHHSVDLIVVWLLSFVPLQGTALLDRARLAQFSIVKSGVKAADGAVCVYCVACMHGRWLLCPGEFQSKAVKFENLMNVWGKIKENALHSAPDTVE